MATRPIAGMISSLFSLWRLSTCDQAALLGLAEEDLELYRAGQLAGGDIEQREGHMLAIHSALRVIFPDPSNRDLAYRWITTKNHRFGARPLDVATQPGGLAEVRRVLEAELVR